MKGSRLVGHMVTGQVPENVLLYKWPNKALEELCSADMLVQ